MLVFLNFFARVMTFIIHSWHSWMPWKVDKTIFVTLNENRKSPACEQLFCCRLRPQDLVDDLPSPEEVNCKPTKRKGADKLGKKNKVHYESIFREVEETVNCCSKRCIGAILTVADIHKARKYFLNKSREAQGVFLLDFFHTGRRIRGQATVYEHFIGDKKVCQKAWIFSYGMSYGR